MRYASIMISRYLIAYGCLVEKIVASKHLSRGIFALTPPCLPPLSHAADLPPQSNNNQQVDDHTGEVPKGNGEELSELKYIIIANLITKFFFIYVVRHIRLKVSLTFVGILKSEISTVPDRYPQRKVSPFIIPLH